MKAVPFHCLRPVSEAFYAGPLASAEELALRLGEGAYLRDGGRAYFLYECVDAAGARTGIVAACPVAELAAHLTDAGATEGGAAGAPAVPDLDQALLDRIDALDAQEAPLELAHAPEPVLDIICAAARAGAPLFSLENGTARLRIWEVRREDSVEALRAMLDRVDAAPVRDAAARAVLAAASARRDAARAAGDYTGREPFNWFLAAITSTPGAPLPASLLMRALS